MCEELDILLQRWGDRLDRLGGLQLWVRSSDFRFRYTSVAFARYLGCTQDEAIGQNDYAFFCRSHSEEHRESDRAALTSGRTMIVPEFGTGEHESFFFETIKIPLRAASGNSIGSLGLACETPPWRRIHERVVTTLANRSEGCPDWFREALHRLRRDAGGELSSSAIAAEVGVHPDSLSRAFRRHFRATLDGYRRWMRIASARDGVLYHGSSLANIALEAGFADQSHMTREMKQFFGLTPAVLRNLSRDMSQFPAPRAFRARR